MEAGNCQIAKETTRILSQVLVQTSRTLLNYEKDGKGQEATVVSP
jgi:hypothetical protein